MFRINLLKLIGLSLGIFSVQFAFANDIYKLSDIQIRKSQNGISKTHSWDCGPRAVSVSLAMLDVKIDDIPTFVNSCPKSVGRPQCSEAKTIQQNLEKTDPLLVLFLPSFGNIGPYAKCLARYANDAQAFYDVLSETKDTFDTADGVLATIVEELKAERPIIAKIKNGILLHYLILVGVDEDKKQFITMSSEDGSLDFYTYDQLQTAMDINSYKQTIEKSLLALGLSKAAKSVQSQAIVDILSGFTVIRFAPRGNTEL